MALFEMPLTVPANLLQPMLRDLHAYAPSIARQIDFPGGERQFLALLRGDILALARADFVHVYGLCTRLLEQVARRDWLRTGNREKALEAFLSYVIAASTVGDACRRAIDFNEFLEDRGYSLALETIGATARLKLDLTPLVEQAPPSLVVANVLFYHNILSWLGAEPIDLVEICLALPEPQCPDPGIAVLKAPVRYGGGESYLAFRADNLARKVRHSQRDLDGVMELIAYDPLLFMHGAGSMAASIRAWFEQLAQEGHRLPDSGATAHHFGISASTLSRWLRDEGTSFLTVKSECRKEIAKTLLGRSGMSMAEIARRLGFHDARSFRRAFAQWTGLLPSDFREQARRPGNG